MYNLKINEFYYLVLLLEVKIFISTPTLIKKYVSEYIFIFLNIIKIVKATFVYKFKFCPWICNQQN